MGEERKKIAFFSRGDDKFIEDIIRQLFIKYETKKITIRTPEEMKLIDRWMEWADICWFEWCDGLLAYGSKLALAGERKLICRLHSYEAFTAYPSQVNWNRVDKLVFVSADIRKFVTENFSLNKEITTVIPNGVDMAKWSFKERGPGFKIAYAGYINYKKGPMLLLHTFKAIYDRDHRYQLYIAGQFQDPRYSLYFKQMVRELGLENNYFFEGWQNDLDQWLEDKNYILCTSVLESQNMCIMQAMAKGIRPVVHHFAGAKEIYDKKYIWNTIGEAVGMVTEDAYASAEYRSWVNENYSLEKQSGEISRMLDALSSADKKTEGFNYKAYWDQRLNSSFNIEGVGYMGLGELYNRILYRNRMDLLEAVIDRAFGIISTKRVLELGPGTGIFTGYFHDKGVKEYEGIDIVEKSVRELQNKYTAYHFRQGNICDGLHYEGSFDLIFAADVLLHITNEKQYEQAIGNISKKLDQHGICILLDPISMINVKSSSPHVVIRGRDYLEEVLERYGLELVQMLPVAYFMNDPFDSEFIGNKGPAAHETFHLIRRMFSDNSICDEEKQCLGEYLSYREKLLLYEKNFGLSEKLLIIQKKGEKQNIRINPRDVLDINDINEHIGAAGKKLDKVFESHPHFSKIKELITLLEGAESSSTYYIRHKMNEFIAYTREDFDAYDFSTARIMLGRREKTADRYEVIEFVLTNGKNEKIVMNNIWYDLHRNEFILPRQMERSRKHDTILRLVRGIAGWELPFRNNMAGFVFEPSLIDDIRTNALAYIWERGIPGSQYLPLSGYLRIAERYAFAGSYMDKTCKVLEAPCGFGYGAAYFSKLCGFVEAVDIASDNIVFAAEAYRQQNIRWSQGDVTQLPYQDNEFDIYVSFEVFEHLPVETAAAHIAEARRVVKDSGKFIISTPNRETRKHVRNPFHIKEYSFDEFKEILKKHFSEVEFYSMTGFQVERGMKAAAYDMIAVCGK